MRFISRTLLSGLLTLLPITLTIYLITWVVSRAESSLRDPIRQWLPGLVEFPGSGLVFAVLLVFIAGLLVNSYFTRRTVKWLEARLAAMPIVRSIYGPLKDVTSLFVRQDDAQAQRVVMVSLGGVEVIGLVTRESFTDLPAGSVPADSVAVFIPFSYGVGGFTVVAQQASLRETSLSADRALQLALTGWIKNKG